MAEIDFAIHAFITLAAKIKYVSQFLAHFLRVLRYSWSTL